MTQKVRFKNLERFGFGPNAMKKLRVCPRCGQMVRSRADTCPNCGERMPNETLFDRYKRKHQSCPHCDTVLTDDTLYCPNCGKLVINEGERTSLRCSACKTLLTRKTLFDEYKMMHFCCPTCDIPLTGDTQYCPHCGRKVGFSENE